MITPENGDVNALSSDVPNLENIKAKSLYMF
jgi:hypothetical protein